MREVLMMVSEDVEVSEESRIIRVDGRYIGYGPNAVPELLMQKAGDLVAAAEFLRESQANEEKEQRIQAKIVELYAIFYGHTDSSNEDTQEALRRFKVHVKYDHILTSNWRRLAEAVLFEQDAVREQA